MGFWRSSGSMWRRAYRLTRCGEIVLKCVFLFVCRARSLSLSFFYFLFFLRRPPPVPLWFLTSLALFVISCLFSPRFVPLSLLISFLLPLFTFICIFSCFFLSDLSIVLSSVCSLSLLRTATAFQHDCHGMGLTIVCCECQGGDACSSVTVRQP